VGLSLAGGALALTRGQSPGLTATIPVQGSCTLGDAITAANTDTARGGCPAGNGRRSVSDLHPFGWVVLYRSCSTRSIQKHAIVIQWVTELHLSVSIACTTLPPAGPLLLSEEPLNDPAKVRDGLRATDGDPLHGVIRPRFAKDKPWRTLHARGHAVFIVFLHRGGIFPLF